MERMLIFKEKNLAEMAIPCSPKDSGGKYPMWIVVHYTNGEHKPPHAHLYEPVRKPTQKELISKFIITDSPPKKLEDIKPMKGKPQIPTDYTKLIILWAKDKDKLGINNWTGLLRDWENLEKTFE